MALHCPHCKALIPMALRRKVAADERKRARQLGGAVRASSADMAAIGQKGGIAARGASGRKPTPRCRCGKLTLVVAAKRNHKC